MTSNLNTKPDPQAAKAASSQPSSQSPKGAAPSVPISLYREVASDLQTTRSHLQSLKTENQQLVQRNQQLRLEIERVVQTALHLRQIADSYRTEPDSRLDVFAAEPDSEAATGSISVVQPAQNTVGEGKVSPTKKLGKLFTEQSGQPRPAQTESTAEISTWWLVLVICLIVLTAFGTGFLIVRPLLPSR